MDYVFDHEDLNREILRSPGAVPQSYREYGHIAFLPPERLPDLLDALSRRGYPDADVRAILGGNFLRVAQHVWRAAR